MEIQNVYQHHGPWNNHQPQPYPHPHPHHGPPPSDDVTKGDEGSSTYYYTYNQLAALMMSLSETTWRLQVWLFASIVVLVLWIMLFTLMRATRRMRKTGAGEADENVAENGKGDESPKIVDGALDQSKVDTNKETSPKESEGKVVEGGNFGRNLVVKGEPDAPDSKYRLNDYWSIDIRDSVLRL